MASGRLLAKFPPWFKPLITVLIIAMQHKKCKKEDMLTFLNVLGEYFISHEKRGHVLRKEDVW